MNTQDAEQKPQKQENLLLNLAFNIIIPALILSKLSDAEHLGTTKALIVALSFPIAYGLWDFVKTRNINIFSVLGFASTLLTGAISLLELDPKYIAIKEAAIPAIIGIVVLITTWTPFSLVDKLILSSGLFNKDKLYAALDTPDRVSGFETTMKNCSYFLAFSFLVSAILNYGLAKYIVVSPAGTVSYNQELGKLTALSYPVIALPCMVIMLGIIYYLISKIKKLTGKSIEEFLMIETK